MLDSASEECMNLAYTDLDHIALGINAMCESQEQVLQKSINNAVNVAERLVSDKGNLNLGEMETTQWTAIKSGTGDEKKIELPKMLLGDKWLGQNSSPSVYSPVVDAVTGVAPGISDFSDFAAAEVTCDGTNLLDH